MANNTSGTSLNVVPSSASGMDPVIEWDEIAREAIAANASSPAVAARALAIESIAVYNAVAAVDGTAGFQSDLMAPAGASASAAVIAAADTTLDALYPTMAAAFDAQATADLQAPGAPGVTAGIAAGDQAAARILAMRAGDGSTASVTLTGGVSPIAWQPTSYAPALTPQYASVAPFGLQSASQFPVPVPPAIGSKAYATAVNQTYSLGALNSTTRSTAETQQAIFWNEQAGTDATAGQWNQIAATVAQANGESLPQDALLFAELNVAEADSTIAAWNSAFSYNAPRPVTLFTDPNLAGINPAIDENPAWISLLAAPAAPEFPEALGALSNAAAAVLGNFFGANIKFTATSESDPGVVLPFGSFSAAANSAAMSEVYGGVAFSFSATAGQAIGTQIGNWTLGLFNSTGVTTTPAVVLNNPNGGATNQDPTVTGFVTAGVTSLTARLPTGTMVNVPVNAAGGFSYTVPDQLNGTADGGQVVTFTAANAAGEQSPATGFTFTLLTRAPSIAFNSDSVTNVGTIGANAVLDGTVGLAAGATLRSLSYSFDNGAAIPVAVNPVTGAFDAPLDDAALAQGQHALSVTAVDVAGNATTSTLTVSDTLPPLTLTGITPAAGTGDVGVTFRPSIEFSRPVNPATLNTGDFYATDSTGAVLPATIVPFADGTGATLIPSGDFSGASSITLHVLGQNILAATGGAALDAAGDGTAGSSLTESYTTVSSAPIPATSITGIVVDPGLDGTPFTPDDVTSTVGNPTDYASDIWKLPIAGAKVFVLGDEANAVTTAANGSFTLTNVPAGDDILVVSGSTATNDPAGYSFASMTFNVVVKAGQTNTVAGDPAIYLPRLANDTLTPVSGTTPVTVTATSDSELGSGTYAPALVSLTISPGSIAGANGSPLPSPVAGIVPVPSSIAQAMLPAGLMRNSFMVSVQAPGAALFTSGASLTIPNVLGLAAGEQTYVFSLDPATGQPEIAGTATASANGQTVTSDPGTRIAAPGLYGVTPAGSNGDGDVGYALPGAQSAVIVAAEARADQSALTLVTQADGVAGPNSSLAFANVAGVGSDVATAINGVAADARAISGNPAAAAGFATLAADALHDATNISSQLGGALPGPVGQWAAGLPAAKAAVAMLGGMAATDASLAANVNAMSNGSASFNAVLGSVGAEVSDQLGIYQRIAADLTTLSVLDGLDLTQPGLGVASGQLATIDEQLPAIVNAFDDYMRAAQQLAGHPTTLGLAGQMANGLASVESATNAARFQNASAPIAGLADNGLGLSAQYAGTTMYAAIQGSDGSLQRLSFTAGQGYHFLFAPNTFYQITVFNPATSSIGESFLESGTSGQDAAIPLAGLAPDAATPGADGLTPTEAFVVGVDNATADNFVPGVTDLAALQQGLVNGSVPADATGVVASLPLAGNAQGLTLASSSSGSTTYAYVATGNEGLAVVDVTNPDAPVALGQIGLGGNATGVAVSSALGIAAVANGGDLALVDVGNPDAPALIQTIPVNASVVRIVGGLAYANNGGTLDSFDLATGNSVQALALSGATITGLAVAGSTIYAMDSKDVLRMIDTSSGAMVLEGAVTLPAGGNQIFVADGVVYAGAQGGYLTVDVSNPSAPVLIEGPDNTSIAGTALALDGSGTGISVSGNSLSVFSTVNPANTGQSIAEYSLPGQASGVAIDDGVGFVADGTSGLQAVNFLPTDTAGVAPVISAVTGPADVDPGTGGTQIYAGAPITVDATVTDDVQVRNVELLLNGSVVASAAGFPFALTATMPSIASTATLEVAAIDTGGNTTFSAPMPVQIVPDTRAFNVLNESVTQGGTLRPFAHSITLDFSKPLDPASLTQSDIELTLGGTAVIPQSLTLSDQNQVVALNFGTLAAGAYELVLDAPSIDDDNNDALGSASLTTDFTVEEFTATFTNAAGGSWFTGSNWSTGGVPGATDSVSIGANGGTISYNGNDSVAGLVLGATGELDVNGGGLTVTNQLQVNGQVVSGGGGLAATGSVSIGATGAIQVNNRSTALDNVAIAAGGSIHISNNNWLVAGGTFANAGLIAMNSGGNDTRIVIPSELSLTNTGTVQLSDNSQNFIFSNGSPATLNNAGNTIAGAGEIGDGNLALNNEAGGTVNATGTNNLIIQGGNDTNTGLMEGTGPAALLLRSASITGTGTIAAPVANSTVDLQSASITGGTLEDANGGVIQAIDRGSSIDDVTLTAGSNLQVTNNNFLTLVGTVTNEGTVNMDSVGNDTRLIAAGSVTLAGTGVVQLSNNAVNFIFSNGAAASLTNATNTIAGAGTIGDGNLTVTNDVGGTIDANALNNNLTIASAGLTNAGLIESTGPGVLVLRSTPIVNSGTIAAPDAGSVVDLQSSSITGGTLQDANGGVIQEIDRGSTINDVTLTSGSNLHVVNNNYLTLMGTVTNDGTLNMDSNGNDTRLIAVGSVTLAGTGVVQLSNNSVNFIFSNGAAATLINTGNTIAGAGTIGDGPLTLNNEAGGTIDANAINNNLTVLGTVTNAGLMESNGPGALVFRLASITNSGTIAAPAASSAVVLQSSSILGGTLEDANGGTIEEVDRGSTLDNATLATGGNIHVVNNEYLTIAGLLTNRGTIYMDSVGNDTRLISEGAVTLTGGGVIQLSTNSVNFVFGDSGAALLNIDNTIQGAGTIGDYVLTLSNGAAGTIDSTGSNSALVLTGLPITNSGLIEDTGTAGLRIVSTTIKNSGTIQALLPGSHVDLASAVIVGGVLASANGGVIYETDRGSVLDNVAISIATASTLDIENNQYLTLEGTLTNQGVVAMSSIGNDTRLITAGSVTLTGGGIVQLSDNGSNSLTSNGAPAELINTNNLIVGGGQIGDGNPNLVVTNGSAGVIDASGGSALRISMGGGTLTNTGTIESTSTVAGNGGLLITSSTIDDTGSNNAGVILSTGTNSHVNLQSSEVLGGTLVAANGGAFYEIDRGSLIDNVVLASGSGLHVNNNQYLTIAGSLTNLGTVYLDSIGNDTRLISSGAVTLTGAGVIQLSDSGANSIDGDTGAVLTNVDNNIQGSGQFGDGVLTIDNELAGTINAIGTNAQLILAGAIPIANAGLIESTGPAGLRIASATINNTGTIAAPITGSHVDLVSATINGGVLNAANGGFFQELDRGSTLNGVTIAAGAVVSVNNNTYLTLAGVVTNEGTIEVNSINNDTRLIIVPGLTLTGGGVVKITDNGANSFSSATTNTVFTILNDTIEGAGNIADGNMTYVLGSGGTIAATGNNALTVNTGSNTISNGGLLESDGPGGLSVTGSGGVANNGTIWADGDALYMAGSVSGTGSERITGSATLRIGGTVAAGQTVSFDPGSTGTLRLDDSQQFGGTIFGLATTGVNSLDLSDISFLGSSTTASFTNGVLTVTDGTHTATIALGGNYAGQTFLTSSDGHNGTTVIDPDPPPDPFKAWTGTLLGSLFTANAGAIATADLFPAIQSQIASTVPGLSVGGGIGHAVSGTEASWAVAFGNGLRAPVI